MVWRSGRARRVVRTPRLTALRAAPSRPPSSNHRVHERLMGLQANWSIVSCVDVYTIYPLYPFLVDTILKPIGKAAWHGINWYFGEPPIEGLAFEMDLRGVRQERWI